MYILRRVHTEQSVSRLEKSCYPNIWIFQWCSEDLAGMIDTANRNIDGGPSCHHVVRWVDKTPDQRILPGCVWQGRTSHILPDWYGRSEHDTAVIIHCMIFNVSRAGYSPVLNRKIMDGDVMTHSYWLKKKFDTPAEYVDYLTTPPGLGICGREISNDEILKEASWPR